MSKVIVANSISLDSARSVRAHAELNRHAIIRAAGSVLAGRDGRL